MEPTDLVAERFRQGYSCSQSVFSVLAEPRGVDLELALRVGAGLGGGIARSAQTCGCVTAAIMALGLVQRSVSQDQNQAEREHTYEAAQRFLHEFTERNGSTICRDLLGADISTPEGHQQARDQGLFKSKCVKLLKDAVEIGGGLMKA